MAKFNLFLGALAIGFLAATPARADPILTPIITAIVTSLDLPASFSIFSLTINTAAFVGGLVTTSVGRGIISGRHL